MLLRDLNVTKLVTAKITFSNYSIRLSIRTSVFKNKCHGKNRIKPLEINHQRFQG